MNSRLQFRLSCWCQCRCDIRSRPCICSWTSHGFRAPNEGIRRTIGSSRGPTWPLARKRKELGRLQVKLPTVAMQQNLTILTPSYSPDPVLTGIQFAQTVQGIQSAGVIACAKHYIAYEQEHFRQATESAGFGFNINDSVSSNLDDVTMHELYLW